jgi:uncharacterized membrane protein YeaQ/YmgE (transglycosylase-associated protein family)
MDIVILLIIGLVAGAIGRFLVPGRDPMGLIATLVLGVIGAFVGGTLWGLITGDGFDIQVGGFILAIIGSVIALLIYRAVAART